MRFIDCVYTIFEISSASHVLKRAVLKLYKSYIYLLCTLIRGVRYRVSEMFLAYSEFQYKNDLRESEVWTIMLFIVIYIYIKYFEHIMVLEVLKNNIYVNYLIIM